jgi:hypothetical protein
MPKKSHKQTLKKGGDGAATYGTYIWGTNQQADPNHGNVIRVANSPLTPIQAQSGGKKKRGGSGDPTRDGSDTAMAQTEKMYTLALEPKIESNVFSSTPLRIGGRKTKRRGRKQRKSKRKYM